MTKGTFLKPGEGEKFWIVGDHLTFKAGPEQTGGKYTAAINWVGPGGGPPPHMHQREDELFYVLEGTLLFMKDRQTMVAGPGTCVYLKKGIPHAFKNVGEGPARFVLVAAPSGFEKFVAEYGVRIDRIPCEHEVNPAAIEKLLALRRSMGLRFFRIIDLKARPRHCLASGNCGCWGNW